MNVGPNNPEVKADGGTWRWVSMPGGGSAQFFPDPITSAATQTTSTPMRGSGGSVGNVAFGQFAPQSGTSNNMINLNSMVRSSSSSPGGIAAPPTPRPAPAAPDLSNLERQMSKAERRKAIQRAMSEYDELEASTRSTGFAAAENAGNIYANRLLQMGINPVGAGVVSARAKLPVFQQLANIGVEREKTRLDAVARADQMAAQIAAQIAQLQMGYTKNLADWNLQNMAYELDLNKFNASQAARESEFARSYELDAARLALAARDSGGRGTGGSRDVTDDPGFNPGYIPSFGTVQPATVNGVPIWGQRSVAAGW